MNTEILFKGLNTSDVEILRAQFGYNDVSKNRSNIVWIFMNIVTNPVIIINLILIIISFYFKYTITLYAFGFLMIFNLINHLISTKNQLIDLIMS